MSRKFLSTIEAVAKYPDKSIYVPPGSGSTTFDNNIEFGHFGGSPSSEGEIWIYKNVYVEGTAYISMSTGSRLTLGADPTIPLHAATKQYVDTKVPLTRTISTTAPLTGGGDLSANRTLAVSTFSSGAAGVVPPSGGGTANYLRADGAWVPPPAAGGVDWTLGYSTYDTRYVNVNGDMMTGNLGLPAGVWHDLGATTALMIGPANGTHVAFSTGGLQAHAAGGVTPQQYWLNQYGGTVQVGTDGMVCNGSFQAVLNNPVTLTSTNNGLMIGNPYAGISMAFSATEIGVRSAGSATRLKLQPAGGDVELGSDTVNSGLLLRGPGPANNGIWMYTGNPGAFTGQIYCDWASLPTMIYESPRIGGVISMRASAAGDTTGKFEVLTGGTQRLSIGDGVGSVTVPLDVAPSPATAAPIDLYGTSAECYMRFYNDNVAAATRYGFIGLQAGWMRLVSDANSLIVNAVGAASDIRLTAGQHIDFWSGSTFTARFVDTGALNVGKSSNSIADNGHMLVVGNNGYNGVTNTSLNVPNYVVNKIGAGAAAGSDFVHFRWTNATRGSITGTAGGTAFNTTSDYRLKHDKGLITRAVDRVKSLKPRRVVWKDDPDETEMDGFFAHEVAEVVPEAVTGEKDAVADKDDEGRGRMQGEMIPQQLDYAKMIPLLTAAVQELAERVRELEGAVA
jgi:hypothetical protein